jgi:hypothetical protein
MVEVSSSTDLVAGGERSEREFGAAEHAGYLIATGTFGRHPREGLPIEHTGVVEPLYETQIFAGVIAELSSLHRADPPAKFILPRHFEPEAVLGYKTLPGNPITTVASAPENVMIWGQKAGTHGALREYFGPSDRTVISLIDLPAPSRHLQPSGRRALEDVARQTGLAHEALGALLGASRRSVYNWLMGRAMSAQFEARALRLRAALRPLAERRAPGEVASWLQAGLTPPAELVKEGRWEDFEAVLREELMPRVAEPMPLEPEVGEPEAYGPEARLAVLSALRTPSPVERGRRPEWRPREVTDTVPLADNEEE